MLIYTRTKVIFEPYYDLTEVADIVKKNESAIATKVLADSFDFSVEYAIKKEWNVNGESVTICLEK